MAIPLDIVSFCQHLNKVLILIELRLLLPSLWSVVTLAVNIISRLSRILCSAALTILAPIDGGVVIELLLELIHGQHNLDVALSLIVPNLSIHLFL